MTNEQREAIELLEGIRDNTWTTKYIMSSDSKKADTVLSLIKEQQEEIENLKNKEVLIKRYFKKCDLIKQKDNQIDLMAEKLAKAYHYKMNECSLKKKELNNIDCNKYKDCTSCIKQYFADKAKIEQ